MNALTPALEAQIVKSGVLQPQLLSQAKDYASTKGIELADALVALNVLGFPEVGVLLSEAVGLPYQPLLSAAASDQVRATIAPQAAAAWGVFPLAYDPYQQLLTLAVDDPAKMVQMERIRRLLLQPYDLAFTVAAPAEIETAFRVHFGLLPTIASREKMKLPSPQRVPRGLRPAAGATRRHGPPPPDSLPYATLSRALVHSVSLLAEREVAASDAARRRIRDRVRYCRLMASRLNLPPLQTDGLTLAAWLSALEDPGPALSEMPQEYDLNAILFADHLLPTDLRVESQILGLVRCYQDFEEREPGNARDVGEVRRHLRQSWAVSRDQQDMLETFLQILIDEEFLAEIEQKAARLLIVDPTGAAGADLLPALSTQGYQVDLVRSQAAAWDLIAAVPPSLVLSELDLVRQDGVEFCRKLKRSARTAHIGFIALARPEKEHHAVACLRAGADDCLMRPVSPDIVAFKIQRFMGSAERRQKPAGLTGSLEDMGLVDMIQILSAGGRSIEISLTHGGRQGLVVLKDGDIVHAHCGEAAGEAALYEIMRWESGAFTTRHCAEPPERNIHGSVMSLLMEGSRLADEQRHGMAATG